MVRGNMLKNFPISITDIKTLTQFLDPTSSTSAAKELKKTETVMSDYVAIPEQTKEKIKTIELTVDVIFSKDAHQRLISNAWYVATC